MNADRASVLVWALIAAYLLAVIVACGYWTYRAVAAVAPTPDPPGYVCTDSGVIRTPTGAISAAECHRG